jgi:hypothetical protein
MSRQIRPPQSGEVPLSYAEMQVAVSLRLVDRSAIFDFEPETDDDERDIWPVERRYVPAGLWGINKPGLRHAQPFDGLVV